MHRKMPNPTYFLRNICFCQGKIDGQLWNSKWIQKQVNLFPIIKQHIQMSEGFQVLKFLLVGDSDSGKSCIVFRYADDTFLPSYLPTIGVDFKIRTISVYGQEVKLQIWDTAGQERFRTITSSYFGGANGVMLVYNVASRSSFEAIRNVWLGEVNKHANASVVMMLIGSKADLHEGREVSYEEGRDLANQLEIDFEEVSAKENFNIEAAFTKLVQRSLSKIGK